MAKGLGELFRSLSSSPGHICQLGSVGLRILRSSVPAFSKGLGAKLFSVYPLSLFVHAEPGLLRSGYAKSALVQSGNLSLGTGEFL